MKNLPCLKQIGDIASKQIGMYRTHARYNLLNFKFVLAKVAYKD